MKTGKEHPNKEKIIEALLAGEKYQWIAETYGCGVATITHYRKRLKLPKRNDFSHKNKEGIMLMLSQGYKQGAIIDKYGCSESTVSRYRQMLNLQKNQAV